MNKENTDWKNHEPEPQDLWEEIYVENIGEYNRLFYFCWLFKNFFDLKQNCNTEMVRNVFTGNT